MLSWIITHIASYQRILWCVGCKRRAAFFIGMTDENGYDKDDYCVECYRSIISN